MPQSLASLNYHCVFSTKHRRRLLTPELEPRLHQYVAGILRAKDSRLLAAGGVADHLHLLASLSRQLAVAEAIRSIKANSTRWIRRNFALKQTFAWQAGYAAFSVSHADLASVQEYLLRQKEHHRTWSFAEELRQLLLAHELDFDERHLWD